MYVHISIQLPRSTQFLSLGLILSQNINFFYLPVLSWASPFALFSSNRSVILAIPSDDAILDAFCFDMEEVDHGLRNP